MKIDKEGNLIFESARRPKQFQHKLKVISIYSTLTSKEAERMNEEFQRECKIHDAEEIESLKVMKDITAGGHCYTKVRKY